MEVGEHRVDPHHAEHAGAHDDHDGGDDALADAAGGGDAVVHQRGYGVGESHDPQTVHAGVDDGGLVGEQGQELPSEQQHHRAKNGAGEDTVQHADVIALKDTLLMARAPVAADEAGAGGVERRHHVEHQSIGVGGGSRAGDGDLVEGVQTCLHEQVGQREDGVLQAGGDADHQDALDRRLVEPQLPHAQAAGVLPPQQVNDDQDGGYPLGNGAGDGHALGGHPAADDEYQIQNDVQHTGHGQVDQGTLGIAGGAEDTVAAVVDADAGQAQRINTQVQHGAGKELLLGVQQAQHRLGKERADQAHQHACTRADQQGGVGGALYVLTVADAQPAGHRHIDTGAHADEQAGEQGHQCGGGAHGAQRHIGIIGIFTGDGHVAEVEQHLQHLGQHQRQAEQQNIFPQRPAGHLNAFHTAFLTPKCSFFYIKRTSFFTWLQEQSISPARGQSKHIYQQTFR